MESVYSLLSLFENFAVNIKPEAAFTHKAAGLMKPVGSATDFVTSDKFNNGSVFAQLLMALDR